MNTVQASESGGQSLPPTPQLGTPSQPAARVPSFHHSSLNGTNDNREYSAHPCASPLRGQRKRCSNFLQANLSMPPSFFRRYQSANPNLHDSLGCPVMCRKRSTSKQKAWPVFSLSIRRESRHDRDVVTEFGAPWMGDTKPERRWHLE